MGRVVDVAERRARDRERAVRERLGRTSETRLPCGHTRCSHAQGHSVPPTETSAPALPRLDTLPMHAHGRPALDASPGFGDVRVPRRLAGECSSARRLLVHERNGDDRMAR